MLPPPHHHVCFTGLDQTVNAIIYFEGFVQNEPTYLPPKSWQGKCYHHHVCLTGWDQTVNAITHFKRFVQNPPILCFVMLQLVGQTCQPLGLLVPNTIHGVLIG